MSNDQTRQPLCTLRANNFSRSWGARERDPDLNRNFPKMLFHCQDFVSREPTADSNEKVNTIQKKRFLSRRGHRLRVFFTIEIVVATLRFRLNRY